MLRHVLTIIWIVGETTDEHNIALALTNDEATRLAEIYKQHAWDHSLPTLWLELDHPIEITESQIDEEKRGLTGLLEELKTLRYDQKIGEMVAKIIAQLTS